MERAATVQSVAVRFSFSAVAVSLLLAARGASLGAEQNYQGGIRGSVRDAVGIVTSAAVTLTEETTGLARSTVTNSSGEYVFANVLPGRYRLAVTAAGYKTSERTAIRIGVQTFATIDIALEVGNVSESVVVLGSTLLLERSNASVSTLVDRAMLDSLPSAGRNVFFMATLGPTVLATGDSQFVRQQDQSNSSLISVAGGPRRNNSYVFDGVPIVDVVNRATFIPSFHAVEELRIQSSAYDAEIGRTSGGVFNTTARSGSNEWHGSGLYQSRPDWGVGRLFFARKNDILNPDGYYHLYGGSAGGPIARNRTFFWASTEGYRTSTARNTVLVLPTDAERRGDFSQSGVTIYDPLTTRVDPANPAQFIRDAFPGNRIPAARMNPVAVAMLQYVPMPTAGKVRPALAGIVDSADQVTGKITHRWSDTATTSGLYAWYRSMEPDARFYGGRLFENAADPGDGALVRSVHMIAVNQLWAAGDQTAVALRYGFNQFLDHNRPASFDPSALGFDPAFLRAAPVPKFPGIGVADYGRGGSFLGDRGEDKSTYYSHNVSVTASRLFGRHTMKLGSDYRLSGVRFLSGGSMGNYSFSRNFTLGPNPNSPAPGSGDAFASFLLGYPAGGGISTSSPIDVYLNYWSGFAQDEVRITSKVTLTLGLRYEFEHGLQERHDRITVGWASDRPFPIQVPGTRPDGTPLALTGGLVYAGVDGAPTHQGHPNPRQFSPRVGVAYAIDARTVVRGGYGVFRAPLQGITASETGSGTRGYNQSTSFVPSTGNPLIPCATCSLTNPFPHGIQQPSGNSLGALTGVGGTIEVPNPEAGMGSLRRYSIDLQREIGGHTAFSLGYLGARGHDLGFGGSSGSWVAINQLDPRYLSLGTSLQQPVANPFFGTALGIGILSGLTVARGQLLRPYPQFDQVYLTRSGGARSTYHAVVAGADRRVSGGWGLRAQYTWSRLEDNQFGESNFFAGGSAILNYYDVDAEYGLSVLDTPHRLTLLGTFAFPLGVSISVVGTYQSGFPFSVLQSPNNSNLFGSNQRPNRVAGVSPVLADNPADAYDASCGCIRWLNPAAWSQAAPFTFGNAPRADAQARTPMRRNWDVAVQKAQRVARTTVTLRAEVINVFDFADLRGPGIGFGDGSFGQIREAAGFPRMLQLMARVSW